ncbi:hypothetical protein V8F06_010573 [Rhypophila decipiens]
MSNQEEPVMSPVPTTKTEDDVPDSVPDSVPTVAIPMEYEPMRYGNSLNAKAVIKGKSALEELGLRYKILRKRKHMDDVEVDSKEWYTGLCEKTLMEARGHFVKAEQALSAGHYYMWHVYRFAIKAVDAPSVSREEYHRRRQARCERASQEALQRLQAEEWKKIRDLKKKGWQAF